MDQQEALTRLRQQGALLLLDCPKYI